MLGRWVARARHRPRTMDPSPKIAGRKSLTLTKSDRSNHPHLFYAAPCDKISTRLSAVSLPIAPLAVRSYRRCVDGGVHAKAPRLTPSAAKAVHTGSLGGAGGVGKRSKTGSLHAEHVPFSWGPANTLAGDAGHRRRRCARASVFRLQRGAMSLFCGTALAMHWRRP